MVDQIAHARRLLATHMWLLYLRNSPAVTSPPGRHLKGTKKTHESCASCVAGVRSRRNTKAQRHGQLQRHGLASQIDYRPWPSRASSLQARRNLVVTFQHFAECRNGRSTVVRRNCPYPCRKELATDAHSHSGAMRSTRPMVPPPALRQSNMGTPSSSMPPCDFVASLASHLRPRPSYLSCPVRPLLLLVIMCWVANT